MALKKYEETDVANIAKTIRSKTGTDTTYNISEMAGGVEEVFEAGRNDVLCNSKYIPKSATGKVISLTDVSEVYHKVKVVGNGEVKVYGKSLLPYPYHDTTKTQSGLTFTDNGDGTITVNGTATALATFYFVDRNTFTLPAGTYGFSLTPQVSGSYYLVSGSTATGVSIGYASGNRVATTEGGLTGDFALQIKAGVTLDKVTFYPQIEVGGISDYEPYTKQTITATPNGAEVSSMCPNMTFIADTDITVDYYSSFGMAEKELAMWNAITDFGNRTIYTNAIAYSNYEGYTIPEGLFKNPKRITGMFQGYRGRELPKGFDLSTFVPEGGSVANCAVALFLSSPKLEKIYDLKIPETNLSYTQAYYGCNNLKEIEMHRSGENTVYDTRTFQNCTKLTHCIFSGVIASDINLQWCKLLDEESLVSLAVALANFIDTDMNPEGSNIDQGLAWTRTITLSPESWAILDNTLFPGTGISCTSFITSVKGWLKA